MKTMKRLLFLLVVTLFLAALPQPHCAYAADKAEIDRDAAKELKKLYKTTPLAKMLGEKAVGVLIFPRIIKGGLIVGAQWGDGALMEESATTAYYRSISVSYGLQAGGQKFGYALFFMKQSALDDLKKSKGWEIGVGPTVVLVDKGAAKSLTTTTAKADVYAFIFDQKGLMAGIGLQGTKITKIEPD